MFKSAFHITLGICAALFAVSLVSAGLYLGSVYGIAKYEARQIAKQEAQAQKIRECIARIGISDVCEDAGYQSASPADQKAYVAYWRSKHPNVELFLAPDTPLTPAEAKVCETTTGQGHPLSYCKDWY